MVDERQARHRDRGHAGAQVDGLEGDLVEPGALAAQRVAERIGKLFEHGVFSPPKSYAQHFACPRRSRRRSPQRPADARAMKSISPWYFGAVAGSCVTYCSEPHRPHFDQLPTSLYWFIVSPPAATHWL